jgi:hypothetical protein
MGHSTEIDPRFSFRAVPILETADAPQVAEPAPPSTVEPVAPTLEALPAASPRPDFPTRVFRSITRTIVFLFGALVLTGGLAILAAIPVAQFLSLGYMLEAGGRVARSGRLRDGFVGTRKAALVGLFVIVGWLALLPVRFIADLANSASIIDPGGRVAAAWRVGLFAAIAAVFAPIVLTMMGIVMAGRYTRARDAVLNFLASLRLPFYFWLGFRGFVAALAWLVIPVTMLAMGRINTPLAGLVGFLGAVLLGFVLMYLPFLQMRLAQTNRFWAGFEWLTVRREFRKAPWAHSFAFFITLFFALPLYLLKIEVVPREAAWIPSLVFVTFIFPARLLAGWALGRARRRGERPRHWFFRWTGRLVFIPAAAFYVLIVFFTQYTSWNGIWSLYEQHAFLVPVPFFGM